MSDILDLRQEKCPLTFVRLRLLLEDLKVGEQGAVMLDKKEARSIRTSLEREGHVILATKNEKKYVTLSFCKAHDND